ncbi:hypothetical protein CCYA_CCYA12G3377 [Cyanidiococcus yangmingshanensis]|nr:hypothetical protein CCYA_CCYA12G3377 [Cyanidiococcus yangmingshanensis]
MRSPGSLRVHQTKEDLVSSLSEEIKSAIAAGPAIPGNSREKIAVAVSGGSLPGLLKAAVARDLRSFANLDKALWIMVDERVVPRNHPESNYCAVSEALSGVVPPDQILGVPEEALSGSTDSIALKYEQLLRSKGISPSDIALALLGMGEDGHTASLFPRTWASAVDVSGTRFYVGVDDSPKAPPRRITLTLSAINAAHKRVFVVTGRNKATAVNHIFQEGNSQRLPAGLVQNAIWLVDEEAVSGLKKD